MENREIPDGWKKGILKDFCIKIGSGSTPRGGSEVYQKEGISLIRSQNILDYSFSYDGLVFIDEEQAKKLSNVEIEKEDVLINITGDSVARVCMVPSATLPARVNQHVAILRVDKEIINPYYLKYYLLNPNFKKHLLLLANSGGTRNALTKLTLESLEISHPSIEEQNMLVEILKSLDEKIELLQEENKTLETLAQTIFTEWFVNFNFPEATGEMEDSELGEIPKGWRVESLDMLSKLMAGGDKPKNISLQKTEELNVPIFSNGVTEYGLFGYTDTPRIFEESITISARGTIGYICLRTKPYVPIVRLISVIPNKEILSAKYLFFWFKNQNILGSGTTQQQLTIPQFKTSRILVPKNNVMQEFTEILNSFYIKIECNQEQIQTIKTTRDTLLPKLTTGEIRVEGFGE